MAFAVPLLAAGLAGGGAAAAGGSLVTALSIGATALSGISQFQQATYQSRVAKNNAQIASDNAERASQASQIEQMRSDREYAASQGTTLALQSASGLDVLGKSQLMTRENIARVRGEAALDIRQKGATATQNLFQDAANFKSEASAKKLESFMDLGTTALSIGTTAFKDTKLKNSLIGSSRSTKR